MPNVGDAGLYGKNAGTWKAAEDVSGRSAGAWADASEVWALQSGTWQMVWQRNAAPGAVTGLAVTYSTSGTTGWQATAAWTLPADTDLASVKVRWTVNGTAGTWQTLAASATSNTLNPVTSGATVSVEVYVQDTGALVSPTVTASGGNAPLDAPPTLTTTQSGLDAITVAWTHPAGTTRTGYTVTLTQSSSTTTWTDSASTTSRVMVVQPGVAATITVTAQDSAARAGRTRSASATASAPAPGTPTVSTWTYSSVTITWTAPTWADGGYEVWRAVGAGAYALLATVAAGTTSHTSAVTEDTNYRYRVRAKGTTYYSPDSGEVRPAIGHAAYTTTTTYWDTATVNLYANSAGTGSLTGAGGVTVPANTTVTSMYVDLATTFATSIFCNYNQRDAYVVKGGVVNSTKIGQKPEPWTETFALSPAAGPGFCGILLVGTGWSWTSTGGFRGTGTIGVSGTTTTNYPAVANGYW